MGLDMYLRGEKYLVKFNQEPEDLIYEDGFRVINKDLEIGYWRKHPDLHGFIVQTFADGLDECQPITLTSEDMKKVIFAIESDLLPKTEGFFFGESENDAEQKQDAIDILNAAIEWLSIEDEGSWKTVVYQASW